MSDINIIQFKTDAKGSPRFCVVDARTNVVLDNANGHGYRSPDAALASYNFKHSPDRKEELAALKARVHGWAVSHAEDVLKIYDIMFKYQKKYGRDALEGELGKELEKEGIELPFSVHTLLKFW